MDRLEIAYENFSVDMAKIEHLVELVRAMRQFGGSEIPGNGGKMEWEEAQTLWHKSKERRTDLPLLAGSLLMYLVGRFEFYVRQSVEITAEEMAESVDCYSKLPDKFRVCLKSQVLEIAQNPRRYSYDDVAAEGYLKDYSSLLDGEYDANKVPSSLLSLTEANLRSRVLADVVKRLGMENVWKDIGKQAPLKLVLETATDGETTTKAQSQLDVLMEERNGLAHPAGEMTFPDPEKVLNAAKFVNALSTSLRDILRVYLAQWSQKASQPE